MSSWNTLPPDDTIQKTLAALQQNGLEPFLFANRSDAKAKVLDLIPPGSEVMNMTSVTLDTLQLSSEINQADSRFRSVRAQLTTLNRETQRQEMNRLGAAPLFAIGSVHAVTQDGHLLIASNTGSQLPAYAYAAAHVIFVVGAQKIVANTDEGFKRIYEYSLPLESERAKKAYGSAGSSVSKILIINKEILPGRIKVLLIKENLGF